MSLSPAQLTVLAADIAADPTLAAHAAAGNVGQIVAAYALDAAPAFWVWKTRLRKDEITQQTSVDLTTFNWTGTGFIGRSQGERDAWRELFNGGGAGANAVNPSLPNVRQAFTDIFSGATAPAPANRAHLLAMARRLANRGERLFATGTGSTASPGLMTFEGLISDVDVESATAL